MPQFTCPYSGQTSAPHNREHIFPKAIGGTLVFEPVSSFWNQLLALSFETRLLNESLIQELVAYSIGVPKTQDTISLGLFKFGEIQNHRELFQFEVGQWRPQLRLREGTQEANCCKVTLLNPDGREQKIKLTFPFDFVVAAVGDKADLESLGGPKGAQRIEGYLTRLRENQALCRMDQPEIFALLQKGWSFPDGPPKTQIQYTVPGDFELLRDVEIPLAAQATLLDKLFSKIALLLIHKHQIPINIGQIYALREFLFSDLVARDLASKIGDREYSELKGVLKYHAIQNEKCLVWKAPHTEAGMIIDGLSIRADVVDAMRTMNMMRSSAHDRVAQFIDLSGPKPNLLFTSTERRFHRYELKFGKGTPLLEIGLFGDALVGTLVLQVTKTPEPFLTRLPIKSHWNGDNQIIEDALRSFSIAPRPTSNTHLR